MVRVLKWCQWNMESVSGQSSVQKVKCRLKELLAIKPWLPFVLHHSSLCKVLSHHMILAQHFKDLLVFWYFTKTFVLTYLVKGFLLGLFWITFLCLL